MRSIVWALALKLPCVLAAALALACQPETATRVNLDADLALSAAARKLRVRVCSQDDRLVLDKTLAMGGERPEVSFPTFVKLEPAGDDAARRFVLLAEVQDAGGRRLAWQRVVGGYRDHEAIALRRTLSGLCNETVVCEANETCSNGACVAAAEAPATANDLPCNPTTACKTPPCNEPSPYPLGFVWQRSNDWKPGTNAGLTAGNPIPDAMGRSTWSHETVAGKVGDWYRHPRHLMVWDSSFFGNDGSWAHADDKAPAAAASYFDHVMPDDTMPSIRWLNPTGLDAIVGVKGHIRLLAQKTEPNPTPADVVVAVARPLRGGIEPLLAMPAAFTGVDVTIAIDLANIAIGAVDSLLFSIRGNGQTGWITAIDDLTITLTSASRPKTGSR